MGIYAEYLRTFILVFFFYVLRDIIWRKERNGLHWNLFTTAYMSLLIVVWDRMQWPWYKGVPIVIMALFLGEFVFKTCMKPKDKGATDDSRTDNGS
jgi:hypothetical protein